MAEFDELLITTGVDALVRLVKEKERIELTEAAAVLNIPETTIEEWGGTLEEEGIIRIEYRLTKIYLVWVAPTEQQVAAEKEEFYKKRGVVQDEIAALKKEAQPDAEGLDELNKSFNELYEKLSPRLAELERKLEGVGRAKAGGTAKLDQYLEKLDDAVSKLDTVTGELGDSRRDIESVGKTLDKGPTKKTVEQMEELSSELALMKKDLASLKLKAERYAKAGPEQGEMPNLEDVRAKLDELIAEFKESKERSARMRHDLTGLQEGKDVLKVIGDSMKDYEKKIASMKADITALSAQAEDLKGKSTKLAERLERDKETMGHFSDSMGVAREILDRFPAQKGLAQELERMQKAEKSIDERTKALKKLLDMAGGAGAMGAEFEDLGARMGERMDELSSQLQDLSAALSEEKETFLAYQSIREKVMPSLERNRREVESLGAELRKMKAEVGAVTKDIEAEAEKASEHMDKEKVREVMQAAAEVEKKRKLLEEVRSSLDSLSKTSENLNKKLGLLSRQASVLELRAGGGGAPAGRAAPEEKAGEELTQEIALTRDEEAEFKRKREELRSLIKKLWEDEGKGK
jgi:chromosome segregation ATPase